VSLRENFGNVCSSTEFTVSLQTSAGSGTDAIPAGYVVEYRHPSAETTEWHRVYPSTDGVNGSSGGGNACSDNMTVNGLTANRTYSVRAAAVHTTPLKRFVTRIQGACRSGSSTR